MKNILLVLAILSAPGTAAAGIDEMLNDALGQVSPTLARIPAEMKKVAIFAIEGDSAGKVNTAILQDQLVEILLGTERFQVIDRKSLKALLEEQALSLTGAVDPGQMVKAGKLIGVEGFFYGAVEVREESVVLTLKLVDVQTSAIVYSKEFTGEAASAARVGFAWGAATGIFGGHAAVSAIQYASTSLLPLADHDYGTATGVTPIDLTLSYRQGFRGMKWAQLGIDLGISYFGENQAFSGTIMPDGSDRRDLVNGNTARWGADVGFEAFRIGVRPKVFLDLGRLLKWKNPWFLPYIGASFDYNMYTMWAAIHRTDEAPAFNDWGMKESSASVGSLTISPLVGFEASLTRSLSLFGEALLAPGEKEAGMERSEPLHELQVEVTPRSGAGVNVRVGVRYSFLLGGGAGK